MPMLTVVHDTVFKVIAVPASNLPTQQKFDVFAGQRFNVNHAFRVGEHCFVELSQPLGTVGRYGYFYRSHVNVVIEEFRGVWIPATDCDVLYSRDRIRQGLHELNNLGFNTIYPVVWYRGFTLYPSPIAQAFLGAAISPNPNFADRDMLAEILEEAQAFNMRVIPWFEYGFMLPASSSVIAQRPELITSDQAGNIVLDGKVWLNPCHPEVQQFLSDLIADVAERYAVNGIQLDDHFGFPDQLGYDSYTKTLYAQENQGQPMPTNPQDPNRQQWLMDKMTSLMKRIFGAVKSKRDVLISCSPNPLNFSRRRLHADWRLWEQVGLIEELMLQVYRTDMSVFAAELAKPELVSARSHIPTAIGILSGLRITPVPFNQIQQQIQKTRIDQFAGSSCFFYETLFREQLSPPVDRNPADLQSLFSNFSIPFSDTDSHWAFLCITALANRSLINGYADGTFRPDTTMTRAEFATLLSGAFPTAPPVRSPVNFPDVPPTHWAYQAVQWSYERGFFSGYPDGTFRPEQPISRVQALSVLATALALQPHPSPDDVLRFYFSDANEIPSWAKGATAATVVANVVVNYPNVRQLRPNQNATRGEVPALFCRALNIEDTVPPQYATWSWGLYDIRGTVTVPFEKWKGSGRLMRDIQVRLWEIGLYPANEINGEYNWKTEQGLTRFCNAYGLPTMNVGIFDEPFALALINATAASVRTASAPVLVPNLVSDPEPAQVSVKQPVQTTQSDQTSVPNRVSPLMMAALGLALGSAVAIAAFLARPNHELPSPPPPPLTEPQNRISE